ncbi:MAG: hypothetical protein J6N51_09480, partial [Selenomonas sp.]|nr:hypothetical protein [Selenomonas sp.]
GPHGSHCSLFPWVHQSAYYRLHRIDIACVLLAIFALAADSSCLDKKFTNNFYYFAFPKSMCYNVNRRGRVD